MDKNAIKRCAKLLKMVQKGILVFENENETSILMDYCIHNFPVKERNIIAKYINDSDHKSRDMDILNSLRNSFYSIFRIENMRPGFGVALSDILRNNKVFILDRNLSRFGKLNMHLAGRVIPFPDKSATLVTGILSGTSMPVDEDLLEALQDAMERFRIRNKVDGFNNLNPKQESDLESLIIRKCLKAGAAEKVLFA